jgi:hypothetical protein
MPCRHGWPIAEGVEAIVKPEIRDVVETTARLIAEDHEECIKHLKAALNLDKSAISRRVAGALEDELLKNLEDRKRPTGEACVGRSAAGKP